MGPTLSTFTRCTLAAVLFLSGCTPLAGQQGRVCPASDSVTRFLLSVHPEWELRSYALLATLRYPLLDRGSLDVQLDSLSRRGTAAVEADQMAIDVLRSSLSPAAFPIFTSRSGLEKLRLGLLDPDAFIRWPELRPRDSIVHPDFSESLIQTFGPACGRAAGEVYLRVQRSNEYQAMIASVFEGQVCCRTNRCPPPPRRWRYGR